MGRCRSIRYTPVNLKEIQVTYMTAFLVLIPIFMFIISSVNLLLTIKYRNDSRKIDALRVQRTRLQTYSEKLVTACVGYIDAYKAYLTARLSLEYDNQNKQEITLERSNYVYKLKDDLLNMQRTLRIISSIVDIEMADTDFPHVKTKLVGLITQLQSADFDWDSLEIHPKSITDITDFDESLTFILNDIIDLLCKTQYQLRQEINETNLYRDIIKHAKHITIDPLFESSEKILENAKEGIKKNKAGK